MHINKFTRFDGQCEDAIASQSGGRVRAVYRCSLFGDLLVTDLDCHGAMHSMHPGITNTARMKKMQRSRCICASAWGSPSDDTTIFGAAVVISNSKSKFMQGAIQATQAASKNMSDSRFTCTMHSQTESRLTMDSAVEILNFRCKFVLGKNQVLQTLQANEST